MSIFDGIFPAATTPIPTAPAGPAYSLTPSPISTPAFGNAQSSTPALGVQTPVPAPAQTGLGNAPQISSGLSTTGLFGTGGGLQLNSVGSVGLPHSDINALQSTGASALGFSATGNMGKQDFSVANASDNTYDSTKLSPQTIVSLINMLKEKQNALVTGKNADGTDASNLFNSDSAQGKVASQLYQSSLYTPAEQSMIQNQQDLAAQIATTKGATARQINNLLENGQISKAEAQGATSELQRRTDADLAQLSEIGDKNTAALTAAGLVRQNSISALTGLQSALQPTSVAPGSTLYNPILGVQYQGAGGAPSTILAQAQTLLGNDQSTGTVHYTPTGQVDQNYYQQLAASQFGGTGNATQSAPSTDTQGTGTSAIPQQYQNYVVTPGNGVPSYVNAALVPKDVLPVVSQFANQAGIKVFQPADVAAIQAIQSAQADVGGLSNLVDSTLRSGTIGKGIDMATNKINDIFGNSPALAGFNQARTSAIETIKAIAGGQGSGLRLNSSEIGISTSNLPTADDNIETAKTKLAWVQAFLQTALSLKMTGQPTDALDKAAATAASQGNYSLPDINPQSTGQSLTVGNTTYYKDASGNWQYK